MLCTDSLPAQISAYFALRVTYKLHHNPLLLPAPCQCHSDTVLLIPLPAVRSNLGCNITLHYILAPKGSRTPRQPIRGSHRKLYRLVQFRLPLSHCNSPEVVQRWPLVGFFFGSQSTTVYTYCQAVGNTHWQHGTECHSAAGSYQHSQAAAPTPLPGHHPAHHPPAAPLFVLQPAVLQQIQQRATITVLQDQPRLRLRRLLAGCDAPRAATQAAPAGGTASPVASCCWPCRVVATVASRLCCCIAWYGVQVAVLVHLQIVPNRPPARARLCGLTLRWMLLHHDVVMVPLLLLLLLTLVLQLCRYERDYLEVTLSNWHWKHRHQVADTTAGCPKARRGRRTEGSSGVSVGRPATASCLSCRGSSSGSSSRRRCKWRPGAAAGRPALAVATPAAAAICGRCVWRCRRLCHCCCCWRRLPCC